MKTPEIDLRDNQTQNHFMNGALEVWQRGVGPTQISSVAYVADRINQTENLATGAATIERSTDVPAGKGFFYSALLTVTAAQSVIAAGEIAFIQHVMEGNILRNIRGKNATLKFWIKSSQVGTRYISFRNGAVDRTLLKAFTINVANTWEQKEIQFTHNETGTWLYDNGAGLRIALVLVAGTTWQTATVDSWLAGQFYSTSSGANFFATNGSTMFVTGFQLNEGWNTDVPFTLHAGSPDKELYSCKRYYESGGHAATDVGNASGVLGGFGICRYSVEKRATPVLVITGNGTPNQFRNDNNGATEGTATVGSNGPTQHGVRSTAGLTDNVQYSYGFTADADY